MPAYAHDPAGRGPAANTGTGNEQHVHANPHASPHAAVQPDRGRAVSAADPAVANQSSALVGQDLSRYLFDAARAGDVGVLESLLARGVQVDARDERGSTALILAAYYGKSDAVQALLAAGASPNLGDSARGNTALMGALFKGEIESARRLLADPRTDVNARNAAGQTAAMFAALFGRADLIEALAARQADFALTDASGATAETLARTQGNAALADRLAVLSRRRPG
ncbi:ankyrin repeat domain-containing protein [Lysobacter capsici]|nr:ankyrin repeat domain-containing protein [Lysobacter capsici]